MNRGKSGWFSAKELAYLRDPKSVDSKHRSTIRDRIEEKVNDGVVHDIERIPEVLDFLQSSTKESLRLQSDPTNVGRGLGKLYRDQLAELMFGLLLSEKRQDESNEVFVERFDSIWEEIGASVRNRILSTQSSFAVRRIFQEFRRGLLEEVIGHAEVAHYLWDVNIQIPIDEFVEWTVGQKGNSDFNYLPEILDTAFGIENNDVAPVRYADYWNLLTQAAADSDIHPPNGAEWTIDYENPTDRDYEMHEVALSALDDELRIAAQQFWEQTQVHERDQLLALGLFSHSNLSERDKQLLERIPCSNHDVGWNRYDTRRANIMVDDPDLPLLSRETVPKRGTDEQRYEFTDYGRFVHWLTTYVEEKGSYPAVLLDFLSDAPEDIVDEANDWVTEYTGAARSIDLEVDELRKPVDDRDEDEIGPVLSNAMLWFRVFNVTDDSEWEDD